MNKMDFLTYATQKLARTLGHEAAARAEKEWAFIEKNGIQTYWIDDDDYPERLRHIPDAPTVLFGKGNISFDGHFLSVVGTRNATDRGKQFTRDIVLELAEKVPNLTIVSGLAYGIDVAAHRAAIEAGISTIIIPAHGLDRIYPNLHRPVAVQSLQKGGILTEYMSGTEPLQLNFLARNRIVAGLSEATLVVESKARGGSLVTARLAFDYNREVFACPGRFSDEQSEGCNNLIKRDMAHLATCADDIIEAMQWEAKPTATQTSLNDLFEALTPDEQHVVDVLRKNEDGMHINTLLTEAGMSYAVLSAQLFSLEMKGMVRALPGAKYRAV